VSPIKNYLEKYNNKFNLKRKRQSRLLSRFLLTKKARNASLRSAAMQLMRI
jgi:hypothetical protein